MSESLFPPEPLKNAADPLTLSALRIKELESRIAVLERQIVTDELTGLLNRRGFTASLKAEHDRIKRNLSRGGLVVMIDLDGFKAINDTHGHAAGDACLKYVGGFLLRGVRGMDAAARLGGDEFALLLANTYPDAALARVQRLSVELNRQMLPWRGQNLFIGASIGVRTIQPEEALPAILAAADADMYSQKRRKRPHPRVLAHPLQNVHQGRALNPPSAQS